MRTPNRTIIFVTKAEVEQANILLESEGFGPDNFNVEVGDGRFMFSAALQDWEKARIESLLSGLTTKKYDYANDAVNPKEKISDALTKEGVQIKPITISVKEDEEKP